MNELMQRRLCYFVVYDNGAEEWWMLVCVTYIYTHRLIFNFTKLLIACERIQ